MQISKVATRWLGFLLFVLFTVGCEARRDEPVFTRQPPDATMTVVGQREYVIRQRLDLVNEGPGEPDKQNIWLALIRAFPPYQDVRSMQISPGGYDLVTDEYGNQYAEFDFSKQAAGTSKSILIDYRVRVYELSFDLTNCEGELIDAYTQPELHIEADNPQIVSLSNELARRKKTVCEQVRAFYDYTADELVYGYNGENWGAQAALGRMGADCTEYASLLAALSRAQGIPARYFEGLRYLDQGEFATERIEHAWTDVYLPGLGWVALDPTLGRSMLNREAYFAHYTPEHIIVSLGASPSTLRGSNYWTHLYWPGNSTNIRVQASAWEIDLVEK